MEPRFVPYIPFLGYSYFAIYRPLISDIGEPYREQLDSDTEATLSAP
jgi:hypothetical protein